MNPMHSLMRVAKGDERMSARATPVVNCWADAGCAGISTSCAATEYAQFSWSRFCSCSIRTFNGGSCGKGPATSWRKFENAIHEGRTGDGIYSFRIDFQMKGVLIAEPKLAEFRR